VETDRFLRDQDRSGESENRKRIVAVPARVGVPILAEFTKAQDPRWRGWYQRMYPRLPQFITRRLSKPKSNANMVSASMIALGYYGAEARDAVPELMRFALSPSPTFEQ